MTDETKVCSKCGEEKSIKDFYKHTGTVDGRRSDCVSCTLSHNKLWYVQNKQSVIGAAKEWRISNPSRYREIKQSSRKAHAETDRINSKNWKLRNRDVINKRVAVGASSLSDRYIRNLFCSQGIRAEKVTPDLVILKREQLQLYRAVKQLKQTINEVTNKGESK